MSPGSSYAKHPAGVSSVLPGLVAESEVSGLCGAIVTLNAFSSFQTLLSTVMMDFADVCCFVTWRLQHLRCKNSLGFLNITEAFNFV